MMYRRLAMTLICAAVLSAPATAACPPDDLGRAPLLELRGEKWSVLDAARRDALAISLLDCLSDPDPVLRDQIGFEALQTWMRAGQLAPTTIDTIRSTLLERLGRVDAHGFAQPFAALVLAEVARIDRIRPFLSSAERAELLLAGTSYLAAVRDFRGFDANDGWRHGVAHGADLMLQLSLNPALDKAAQHAMLDAIATQLQAAGTGANPHFYQFGEGERLMAPVFYLARRDALASADWDAWLERLCTPLAPGTPTSLTTLARSHNLKSFLLPLLAALNNSPDQAQRARLLAPVGKALKRVN
jgi:hypothetical protein